MPFYSGIYKTGSISKKGGVYQPRFHSCGKCGKEFEEGEKIWKHVGGTAPPNFRSNHTEHPRGLKEYLCEECYNAKFVEV